MAALALRDNYSDLASADRELVREVPVARARLESALAGLRGLQYELKTHRRLLVTSEGHEHEVPSPFWVDDQGRDDAYWKADAAAARAEITKLSKGPAPAIEHEIERICDLRAREAMSLNTVDRIRFNPFRFQICACCRGKGRFKGLFVCVPNLGPPVGTPTTRPARSRRSI